METTAKRMLTGNKAMAEAIAQEMERDLAYLSWGKMWENTGEFSVPLKDC